MIKYIENLAESIVDFLENRKKIKGKSNKKNVDNDLMLESLDYVCYNIIPYKYNDFWFNTFSKFLNNFSYYTDRINFFVYWNNSKFFLVVCIPEILEKKFVSTFYNFFPSSKIEKLNKSLDFVPSKFVYTIWEDIFKLKQNSKNFLKNTFSIFRDIPTDSYWFIKYSLVLNSTWEIEYESLLELIWKWIKLFFWWIYYFLHQVFIWKPPKKKLLSKKQELKTWIKWTALSVWIWWYKNFEWLAFRFFEENVEFPVYLSDKEIFSKTKIEYFSRIFYIPTNTEKIPFLNYITYKRLPPPPNLPEITNDVTVLWKADWADESIVVWLKPEDKARHVYIIWKTWVGKSTLLSNMILSDLEHKKWLALIDPHGDLVNTILKVIPDDRKDDLVLFDVSNISNPVGFNPFYELSALSDEEKEKNKDLTVSTLLSVFKKLYWYSWWPRLEYILRNVLLTLSDYPDANFLHITKLLTDKQFRIKVVKNINDPVIKNFWEKEFDKWSDRFASEAISPILNKVWQFISSSVIRNIFWQQKSTLSIKEIMDNGKILLVNLSKGLIWEDNSSLLGSFIVSQIQVEAMKRASMPMEDRKQFTLYIDEFQNFATESFNVILSEARKYNLSLVVANQYISQLDESVQNAIFWNVWNLIAFSSGNQDAEILSKQFKNKITAEDIVSIPRFKAYAKIMIDGISSEAFGISTYPISQEKMKNDDYVKNLINLSNSKYTKPRKEVEEFVKKVASSENKKVLEEKNTKKENKINSLEKTTDNVKQNKKTSVVEGTNDIVWDIFEWVIKLKFNYGLFVVADGLEWLLHKKNIHLPEWINWKEYFNVGDSVRVKLIELKDIDWQKKAVWEHVV